MEQRIGYPSNSYKVAYAGSTPACSTFLFFTLWSFIMKTFLGFMLGFFLGLSLCLGVYVVWEEYRPQKPMLFNLMMQPNDVPLDPDKFSNDDMLKFEAISGYVS